MRERLYKAIAATLFCAAAFSSFAAEQGGEPRVTAKITPDSIAIGDRFNLDVTVTQDVMQVVQFPEFKDKKLADIIEIVNESKVDTLKKEGRNITISKRYTLTTFEDGYFGIGRFPVLYVDKNIVDTLWSVDSLSLKVGTFQIDTLKQTIRDIKKPMPAPLKVGEVSGYALIGLAVLLAIAALVWWIISRRRNLTILGKPKPVEPPHVAAIRELEALHNQKLWQNNKHKAYYTRLTDILREYLQGRYGIRAMEMTSEEIATAMQGIEIQEQRYADLREILRTADFVKFAKYAPDADSNETAYSKAYYFVEETKQTDAETGGKEAQQ
jgi:hypothetical protein